MTTWVYYVSLGLSFLGLFCIAMFLFSVPMKGPDPFTYSIYTIGIPSLSFGLSLKTPLAFSQALRFVLLGALLRFLALGSIVYGLVRDAQIHASQTLVIVLDSLVLAAVFLEFLVWFYLTAVASRKRPGGGGCCGWKEVTTEAWDEKGEE
jgi:hypothetical protein